MQIQDFRVGVAKPGNDWEKEIERNLSDYTKDLKKVLNDGIRITDNLDCYIGTVTMPAVANTDLTVAHGLARIPNGYLILGVDRACNIYNVTASTTTNIYLRCDVVSAVVKILIL